MALGLDPDVTQVHSAGYRDPDDLPYGSWSWSWRRNPDARSPSSLAASMSARSPLAVRTRAPRTPQLDPSVATLF